MITERRRGAIGARERAVQGSDVSRRRNILLGGVAASAAVRWAHAYVEVAGAARMAAGGSAEAAAAEALALLTLLQMCEGYLLEADGFVRRTVWYAGRNAARAAEAGRGGAAPLLAAPEPAPPTRKAHIERALGELSA
eukprot:4663918-Prymnesium_polylepis.1